MSLELSFVYEYIQSRTLVTIFSLLFLQRNLIIKSDYKNINFHKYLQANSLSNTSSFCSIGSSSGEFGLEELGDNCGVDDSIEGTKLQIPLDSLLGDIGEHPVKLLKPRSNKILIPKAAKWSDSRPDRGIAIVSAIFYFTTFSDLLLFKILSYESLNDYRCRKFSWFQFDWNKPFGY